MARQLFRQVIFAFALLAILLVGSVCANTSVDLGADVDGSSVLLESSIANDPMTGVQISGRRRVIAVRKRLTPTASQTQPLNGDEIFEPFTAEELEAMRIIAQYPSPTGQIDPALIKLLQDPPIPTPAQHVQSVSIHQPLLQKRLRSTVDSAEAMPVKNRRIDETTSVPISRVEQPIATTTNGRRVVRKPVTSKPRKMVNRTPKAQGMNTLQPTVQVMLEAEAEAEVVTETETEADAEQENALATGVSAYPAFSLGQVVGGLTQTIGMLRIAIQADPAIVACPGALAGICMTANHFTYVLDPQPAADLVAANAALVAANTALANGAPNGPAQVAAAQNQVRRITSQIGRIHFAFGFVRSPPPPPGTNPSPNSKDYCDVLFNPFLPFIGVPAGRPQAPGGGRNLWQAGHIIGNALGGVNGEPINFYPQHRSSNNAGGRWGKAEAIALGVAAHCAPAVAAGAQVSIGARFTAWDARGIYPTGGRYTIFANAACVAQLGAGCTQNGAAGPAATAGGAYVQTFCRWSVPAFGGLLWTTPVTNGAADRVNNLLPAQAARFFP